MKFTFKNTWMVAVAAVFAIVLMAAHVHADGSTWYVGTTVSDPTATLGTQANPYPTIQGAIDASTTVNGDTINVTAGTYMEAVTVNKSLTISGAGAANTELVVAVPNNGFSISADNVTIEGFDIEGPANLPYTQFAWGGDVSRGIAISNGVQNFTIENNTIENTRNNILVDGRNSGSIIGNTLDNSKSAISIQYTDGTGISISGNREGTNGNEWGINLHLNGHDDGTGNLVANSVKIAADAPLAAQQNIVSLSTANNGWSVQDQGYSTSNRTSVNVSSTGSATNQGSLLTPVTLQAGLDGVIAGGTVRLISDVTVTTQANISKSLTLDGQTHKLLPAFTAANGSNNSALAVVNTSNVTVKNLIEDGTGGTVHGFNVFGSTGVTFDTVTASNNKKNGISFNGGSLTVNNLTTSNNAWGGIDLDIPSDATINSTALTITGTVSQTEPVADIFQDDNSKNVTVSDPQGLYASATVTNNGVAGTVFSLKNVTVTTEAGLRAALANPSVSTIVLGNDITLAAELDVTRAVTIDGATHKITASFNSASVIQIGANDVTLKNLVEDGTGTTGNRGINLYKVTGITLDTVTVSNNAKYGLEVNGSTVTVKNISTAHNGWGGIDVDLGSGVTTPASLTITGVSSHTESAPAITVDDTTKAVSVTDANNQYTFTDNGNTRTYTLITQATISNSTSSYPVTSSTLPISLNVTAGTTAPTINVSSLVTAGTTATLPQISVTSNNADVSIAAGTTVTSGGTSTWNGIINAPVVTTNYTLTPDAGTSATAVLAIEVGAGDTPLTFSNAVKLTFPGQAGNLIGWSQAGAFHAITDVCDSATNPTLAAGADCRIDAGSDLVVWTKHFTTFVTYTQASTGVGSVGGGSGGGGVSSSSSIGVTPSVTSTTPSIATTAPVGQVLGAQSFHFTLPLKMGIHSDEVLQLQTRLNADGAKLALDSKFGPKTKAALVAWQKAHSLTADGVVGPKTRTALNA